MDGVGTDGGLAALFVDVVDRVADVIATDAVAAGWMEDSALIGYSVGGLCGHLARAVFTLEEYLDRAPPPGRPPIVDAAQYFAAVLENHDPQDSAVHEAIRERGRQVAEIGPEALAAAVRTTETHLRSAIEEAGMAQLVTVRDELAMTVEEYVRTRLTELVVHLDDVAVSIDGLEQPALPDAAYVEVAGVLGRLAALRTGGLATIRSLARRERHPQAARAL